MILFTGYNFLGDVNALDPYPTAITGVNDIKVQGGIFDHLHITADTTSAYSAAIPTAWDFNTILNCDFDGTISGGNIDEIESILKNITAVRIKRRVKGDFEWTTIKTVIITSSADLSFIISDNIALNDTTYEYAWVPLTGESPNYVEGNYIVEEVLSQFKGVFICDADTIYKFFAGVEYGTNDRVQQIGVYPVLGKSKPIIISNGLIDYQTGSISGLVLPQDFYDSGEIDPIAITKQRDVLSKFLANKKAKIIKDYNGNSWLCYITSNVSTTYNNSYAQGMMSVAASWTEIGDATSKHDLFEAGLISTED